MKRKFHKIINIKLLYFSKYLLKNSIYNFQNRYGLKQISIPSDIFHKLLFKGRSIKRGDKENLPGPSYLAGLALYF